MSHFPILKKINDFKAGIYFPIPPLRPLILLCKLVFILICFLKKNLFEEGKKDGLFFIITLVSIIFPSSL